MNSSRKGGACPSKGKTTLARRSPVRDAAQKLPLRTVFAERNLQTKDGARPLTVVVSSPSSQHHEGVMATSVESSASLLRLEGDVVCSSVTSALMVTHQFPGFIKGKQFFTDQPQRNQPPGGDVQFYEPPKRIIPKKPKPTFVWISKRLTSTFRTATLPHALHCHLFNSICPRMPLPPPVCHLQPTSQTPPSLIRFDSIDFRIRGSKPPQVLQALQLQVPALSLQLNACHVWVQLAEHPRKGRALRLGRFFLAPSEPQSSPEKKERHLERSQGYLAGAPFFDYQVAEKLQLF